jgi:hypothetical protein
MASIYWNKPKTGGNPYRHNNKYYERVTRSHQKWTGGVGELNATL